jgi:protein SCO1
MASTVTGLTCPAAASTSALSRRSSPIGLQVAPVVVIQVQAPASTVQGTAGVPLTGHRRDDLSAHTRARAPLAVDPPISQSRPWMYGTGTGTAGARENIAMVRGWPVRLAGALAASAVVVAACGGGTGVPGPPSAYLGTVLDRPVPDSVADLPLTTDAGQPATLAAFHGQVVVLADFLTLCQETCPLTAGNLLVMDRAVIASGLAGRVRFVELTVDPGRDTPARLRAYRALVDARANWSLLTGRPDVIKRIWGYFGVWYQRVAKGSRPGVDWLTGKPLSYDITHQDALIYLDASGRERFLVVGSPNANGASVAPALRRFLSAQGRADLSHPDASTWTAAEALSPIAWLTGRQVGLPAG